MNSFCTNVVKQAARFYYYYDFLFFLHFYCSFRLAPPPPPPQKKTLFHAQQSFFYISLPLFCTTTGWNFLVTRFIVVLSYVFLFEFFLIHLHMDDVYNWQVIIIFHVHKLLPCLSIVSSKYDIWDLLPYMYSCRRWRDIRTVTWLPQFLASISYHFFLPMVLLCAHELHYNLCSMSAKKQEINKKQIAVCITLTVVRTLYNPGNNSPWTTSANYILL